SERRTGTAGREHAEPRRPREVGAGEGAHGAEYQRAFKSQIDASALFRERLSEAHQQVGGGDADRSGNDRQNNPPPPPTDRAIHASLRARKERPTRALVASTLRKIRPCRTVVAACGMSKRRCNRPPLAEMPPSSRATMITARAFWRARNATRMPE